MNREIDWERKVTECRESKMSKSAWCKEQGIAPSTLHYHIEKASKKKAKKFIELKPRLTGIRLRIGPALLELDPDFDEVTHLTQKYKKHLIKYILLV